MPIIKRYSNRKLYDTQAKRYITLEGLGDLIRQGEEVHITDHETGEDITALILAQTVFELEKRLKGGLPGTVLTGLIRAGSDTLGQLREVLTFGDAQAQVDAEIEQRIQYLIKQGELDAEQGRKLLDKLIAAGPSAAEPAWIGEKVLAHTLKQRGIPSREDVQQLSRQVEALSAELEQLAAQAPKTRSKPRKARTRTPKRK